MTNRYDPPRLEKLGNFEDLPEHLRVRALDLLHQKTAYTAIAHRDHHWISVSESFARLLGCRVPDLIGKKVDEFTSPGSIEVELAFDSCFRLGEREAIWLFAHRDGRRVLVNYHARVENDHSFAHIRPLLVTETWTSPPRT